MRLEHWWLGARPKTLPAAIVPVAVGTAAAYAYGDQADGSGDVIWWRAAAALTVAVALQLATNYVNDYADGERGTDDSRVGPTRLVAGGLASATEVKRAALASFALAGVVGSTLVVAVGWELLIVGAASMLAGWAYTGGPKPYGYYGLGELFVFVFFGVVATVGSTYVQIETITWLSVAASLPVGFLAVALLVINNLRDIPTDIESGKRTLAVRLGDRGTRNFYATLFILAGLGIAACVTARPWSALAFVGLLAGTVPLRSVLGGETGHGLIPTLAATGRTQMLTGVLLAAGIAVG